MSVPEYDTFDLSEYPRSYHERYPRKYDYDYDSKKYLEEIKKINAERREAKRKAILNQKRYDNSQDIRSIEKFS